jgi:broad specificity polyphosphatase/5'/3'-nucleotidase SurE
MFTPAMEPNRIAQVKDVRAIYMYIGGEPSKAVDIAMKTLMCLFCFVLAFLFRSV